MTELNACQRCGTTFTADVPTPDSCSDCPPVPCADCDGPDDRKCTCWVNIENDSLADHKAMFAAMGLSVTTDGQVTP